MARNNKAIQVKIATTKVIAALESKLAQLKTDKKNQASNEVNFEKLHSKWRKDVTKLAIAQVSKAQDVSTNIRYNGAIRVEFDIPKDSLVLPEEPEKDFETLNDWQYKEMFEEIENAIRILKMTDEETVSTSTYNAIAKYL